MNEHGAKHPARVAARPPAPATLDRLKLLGLVAMLADHLGKAWHPLTAWPWHLAGRPALLLFGLVMAHRVAEQPARAARYLPRLLFWGALAQPAHEALGNEGLNILFTYAAGCLVCLAPSWQGAVDPCRTPASIGAETGDRPWGASWAALLVIALAGPWVEYGWAGVMLVPAGVLLQRHAPATVVPGLATVCLLANAPASPHMLLQMAGVLALAAVGASALLAHGAPGPSRPLQGFPALYAGHLSLLALGVHAAAPPDLR